MSSCSDPGLRERLLPYLDGELSDKEAMEVTLHLARCPACKKEVQDLRSVLKLLLPLACPPPEVLLAFVEERLQDEKQGRHIGKCPICQEAVRGFKALEHDEPADRGMQVPAWVTENARKIFPRKHTAWGMLDRLFLGRPAMAFSAYMILALFLCVAGISYRPASSPESGTFGIAAQSQAPAPPSSSVKNKVREQTHREAPALPKSSVENKLRDEAKSENQAEAPAAVARAMRMKSSIPARKTMPAEKHAFQTPVGEKGGRCPLFIWISIPFWVLAAAALYRWIRGRAL